MYMMRLVYHCKRGRCLDVVECLRFLNQIYTGDGYKNGKIYVDRMGRMDRALYEFEVANLDQFYTVLKERYAHLASLGPEAQQLVDHLNEHAIEGTRELYEVVGQRCRSKSSSAVVVKTQTGGRAVRKHTAAVAGGSLLHELQRERVPDGPATCNRAADLLHHRSPCYPGAAYVHPKTPAAHLRPSGR